MKKGAELYRGKAKTVYHCDDPTRLILHFRNDTSAFDGARIEQLSRKGEVNNRINAFVMEKLSAAGVPTHFDRLLSADESLVKRLDMLPVECVVRNIAAGSLCKRLGVEEGLELEAPLFEFFLKNDELHDPMINDYHIRLFGWGTQQQIDEMQALTFTVNGVLKPMFAEIGILLVDYKLEFGVYDGELVLGDEFTPDGCRLWDAETREKLDKDRFRRDLGGVVEAYEEVARRLGVLLD
ncbi:MAG: phosphoribosylaminoimidazolesuccinocarboxamide synthase [Gammaproteobacteria bacterium]|nr:MAG: phosphoribosylaminoimidazolesuccinocarboxamide synthase [Gammaproteobacteria bacterium]RLA11108.1 MAG: phosphoribosylaminoimidazolesuccinocarboxamide synthase [Gammaproteobacteria bacterium]